MPVTAYMLVDIRLNHPLKRWSFKPCWFCSAAEGLHFPGYLVWCTAGYYSPHPGIVISDWRNKHDSPSNHSWPPPPRGNVYLAPPQHCASQQMRSLRPHPAGWLQHKALSTGKSRWLERKGTGPFRLANYAADGKLLGKNGKVWWHCLLPKANFGACSNKTLHKEEQQSLSYLHNYSLSLGSQVDY